VDTRAFRSLTALQAVAIMAATFAVMWGALFPYAAQAAAQPGMPLILCSTEGPRTVVIDPVTGQVEQTSDAPSCPACVLPPPADLPPAPEAPAPPVLTPAVLPAPVSDALLLPPARAPPRPPSTAPPHA
jgi:hypothetical protein